MAQDSDPACKHILFGLDTQSFGMCCQHLKREMTEESSSSLKPEQLKIAARTVLNGEILPPPLGLSCITLQASEDI